MSRNRRATSSVLSFIIPCLLVFPVCSNVGVDDDDIDLDALLDVHKARNPPQSAAAPPRQRPRQVDPPDVDDGVDMEMLLDILRRTRPPVAPAGPRSSSERAKTFGNAFGALFEESGGGFDDNAFRSKNSILRAAEEALGPTARESKRKYRKDSFDSDSLRTREKYQNWQADRVRVAFKEGKPQIVMAAKEPLAKSVMTEHVPCALEFYKDAYGVVRGCTPGGWGGGGEAAGKRGSGGVGKGDMMCRRIVRDGFGDEEEMEELAKATKRAMVNLFHQGGTTSLAPASSLDRLGVKGGLLFQYYLAKVKLQILEDFNLDVIYDSGALLTRLEGDPPLDEWDMEPGHVYWNPHVDKANIPTYDYSALLYLNTHGRDFEGGEFSFIDDDADRLVYPRAGRLVTFTSGPENLHQVREVTEGTRYVLAMWFTCSEEYQYRDEA